MTCDSNAASGFDALGLPEFLLSALANLGFATPTPIQEKTIPSLLEGRHVLGEAQTGTGKTAAFGLPALAQIDIKNRKPQMLVLAPTRELAIQVAEALESFAKNMKGLRVATLYGGQSYGPQFKQLESGAQVVVGTPGRLMDHLRRRSLDLSTIRFCCLDEADEMLNMGFLEDIEWILEHLPKSTQMALFSATMPAQIRRVANQFLVDPVQVKIAPAKQAKANITQLVWKVSVINKATAIERIIETQDFDAVLIFVRTRNDTVELAEYLEKAGIKAAALNGDMNQAQRERTVEQMRSGQISVVIATDVVARGLDIPRIDLVINYDLPGDVENYVHRIGRTGRAGRAGTAISFARPREMYNLKHYERATSGEINSFEMPTIAEISASRIAKVRQELSQVNESVDLQNMREIVESIANDAEISMVDLAAALLYQKQLTRPLQPKPDPVAKPARERRERQDRQDRQDRQVQGRPGRGEGKPARGEGRKSQVNTADVDWQTFRLEVGKQHGARPGDIVGAIANEINLDSGYIGQINLFERHSFVQLPKGIPANLFQQLKRVRVRQQALDISVSEAPVVSQPRRPRREKSRRPVNH